MLWKFKVECSKLYNVRNINEGKIELLVLSKKVVSLAFKIRSLVSLLIQD